MLCDHCLERTMKKLTPNDVFVLHELKDYQTPQTGAVKAEIYDSLIDTLSHFQLTQALMRLELLGLIGSMRVGRQTFYYCTDSGHSMLELLSEI